MFLTILKFAIITVNVTLLAYSAITDRSWMKRYRKINYKLILVNILFLIFMVSVIYFLSTTFPKVMGFGLPKLIEIIFKLEPGVLPSMNINLLGVDIPFLGILICLLLLTAIPHAAEWEEEIFRAGTENWGDGLLRSILFGLVHMLVFVSLGAAIGLILAGLFFTSLYFKGGIELSSQGHFQHNLLVITIILVLVLCFGTSIF